MNALTRWIVGCVIVTVATGCDEDPAGFAEPASLQIRPAIWRVVEGTEPLPVAFFFDAAGVRVPGHAVEWESLDEEIVSFEGSVGTAEAPGWARIVATSTEDESLSDTSLIAVGIRFSDVTSGREFSCGWTEEGAGWCWGAAYDGFYEGTLGAGTGQGSPTPVAITGGHTFTQIDAGRSHVCGIAGGKVYCWGYKRGAALSPNACGVNACDVPTDRGMTGTFTVVSVPPYYDRTTCATGPAGLHCWGAGAYGAMGLDPLPCSSHCAPRLVSTTLTKDVAMGRQHGCALDPTGKAFCWGDHQFGQLGIGDAAPATCEWNDTPCSYTPIAVATSERFDQLDSGTFFTCGLTTDGRVLCWGEYDGFASEPANGPGPLPVEVSGLVRFDEISAGDHHVCGVATTGDLYCWGAARWQFTMGEPDPEYGTVVSAPRLVDADGARFADVSAGIDHTCAVADDGSIRCMGSSWGIGQGTFWVSRGKPVPIMPPGPMPDELDLIP